MLLTMSTTYFLILNLLLLLPPQFAQCSCPPISNFACGPYNLSIEYPFFTDRDCGGGGLHYIQCINLVPLIQFHGEGFLYPVCNISYRHRSLVVHDLKLSAYFRGSDCVFLYDFSSPVPRFNVSNVTDSLSSGKSFFDCDRQGGAYDFSHDVFEELHNFTPCRDYTLFYSSGSDNAASSCPTSSDLWFDWKLSFGDGGGDEAGGISLLSAGFSRKWTLYPGCFDCGKTGVNCNGSIGAAAGEQSSCGCTSRCWRASKGSSKSSWKIILAGVLASVIGFLLVCGLCLLCYRRRCKQRLYSSSTLLGPNSTVSTPSSKTDVVVVEPTSFHYHTHLFSYEELAEATKDFDPSQEIGDGGYGSVYKGVLRDGRTVAVKRLYETSYKRVEQFVNEVEILSGLRHPNLVTLYGCTSPRSPSLLLVYEFVPNGTLADHLHDPSRSGSLPISVRLSMAVDAASALSYLHSMDIIHRDVKTHNILVDQHYNAKVADFGLSRLFPANATHVSTAPQGTPGYLDPEYHRFYQLTEKSDVYSYGVVLMELLSSRPAVDVGKQPNEISLAMMAISKIQKGELDFVDPALMAGGAQADLQARRAVVEQVAELAFRCLQMDRELRPSIKEVLEELREVSRVLYSNIGEEPAGEFKPARDDLRLLKDSAPFSPNSVTHAWISTSTTPTTST